MLYRIKVAGPTDLIVDADEPQLAVDKFVDILNDHGFEIYIVGGGTGKAGERIGALMRQASNIIIPDLTIQKAN